MAFPIVSSVDVHGLHDVLDDWLVPWTHAQIGLDDEGGLVRFIFCFVGHLGL